MTRDLLAEPAIRNLLDLAPDRALLGITLLRLGQRYTVAELTAAAVAARGASGRDIASAVSQAAARLRYQAEQAKPVAVKFLKRVL
jgi:hypothetical protein